MRWLNTRCNCSFLTGIYHIYVFTLTFRSSMIHHKWTTLIVQEEVHTLNENCLKTVRDYCAHFWFLRKRSAKHRCVASRTSKLGKNHAHLCKILLFFLLRWVFKIRMSCFNSKSGIKTQMLNTTTHLGKHQRTKSAWNI